MKQSGESGESGVHDISAKPQKWRGMEYNQLNKEFFGLVHIPNCERRKLNATMNLRHFGKVDDFFCTPFTHRHERTPKEKGGR